MTANEVNSDADVVAGLPKTLARMRAAYRRAPSPPRSERDRHLRRLHEALLDFREPLTDAISADFGSRSIHETLIADIFLTAEGINTCARICARGCGRTSAA